MYENSRGNNHMINGLDAPKMTAVIVFSALLGLILMHKFFHGLTVSYK